MVVFYVAVVGMRNTFSNETRCLCSPGRQEKRMPAEAKRRPISFTAVSRVAALRSTSIAMQMQMQMQSYQLR